MKNNASVDMGAIYECIPVEIAWYVKEMHLEYLFNCYEWNVHISCK